MKLGLGNRGRETVVLDPRFALQSIVAHPPPPEGTYLVDAIVVHVQVCDCPPVSRCDCPPDGLVVTNDAADSASWSLRVDGIDDLDRRFRVGARYRLAVRIEHGEAAITDAAAKSAYRTWLVRGAEAGPA